MCGIVGCAGLLNIKHERAFKNMLILDSLRGVDSTGMMSVDRQGIAATAKAVGNPFNLLESRAFAHTMQGFHSVLLGHNRYATTGKVNVRNAHPFEFDRVIGVHNGTLKNKSYLDKGHSFDVDSEALYHHINKLGVEDAIKGLDGAWALVWYDQVENELNFLRNKERTLYVSTTKDRALFWASEAWMIEAAASREELEYSKPELLPVDQLHTIPLMNTGELGKPVVVPLASRFQPPVYAGYHQPAKQTGTPATTQGGVQKPQSTALTVIDATKQALGDALKVPDGQIPPNRTVTMTVYGSGVDTQGASYYLCRCASYPGATIRLFKGKGDRVDLLNKMITGEVHGFLTKDRIGTYHKVVHSTVKLLEDDESPFEQTFKDHKGNLLTQKEFEDAHGSCSFCTGVVSPELGYRFTTQGDVICHECASDVGIQNYVQLA